MSGQSWDTIRAYTQRGRVVATIGDADETPSASGDADADETPTTPDAEADETPSADDKKAPDKKAPADPKTDKQKKPPSLTERLAHLPKLPKLPTPIDGAVERVSTTPTPGGVGLLVLALGVFVLAIVPVGPAGESRLFLMWKALLGQVDLPSNAQPATPIDDLQAAAEAAVSAAQTVATDTQIAAEAAITAAQFALY